MTQFTLGTIDPVNTSGTALAEKLQQEEGAQNSNHRGADVPDYAVAGMIFPKVVDANTEQITYIDDDGDQIPIGTINPTTNQFTPAGISNANIAVLGLISVRGGALGPRFLIDGFIDGFVDQTGVDTAGSSNEIYNSAGDYYGNRAAPSTSYANTGGTGNRTSSITVTSNITFDAGTISNLVDGSQSNNLDMPGVGSGAIANGAYVRFDFGASNNKYFDEIKIYSNAALTNGNWEIEVSADGTNWDSVGSFTWTNATQTVALSGVPADGRRYIRMVKVGTGTWTNQWFNEVEFKLGAGSSVVDMDLKSNATTAAVEPTRIDLTILHDPQVSVTLNTDITASVSRDGGSTWEAVALVNRGPFDATYDILTGYASVSGQPSGSSVKWRIQTANSKEQRIAGVAADWR